MSNIKCSAFEQVNQLPTPHPEYLNYINKNYNVKETSTLENMFTDCEVNTLVLEEPNAPMQKIMENVCLKKNFESTIYYKTKLEIKN